MLELDAPALVRLSSIGLNPAILGRLHTLAAGLAPDDTLARVVELQREGLVLHDGARAWPARLHPSLRHALDAEGDVLAVGDWVVASADVWQGWWVRLRVPPVTQLARRLHDGRDKVERAVLVANVDCALVVMGLTDDFSTRRLDRYLGLVTLAGIDAVVVLSKADLAGDAADGRIAEARARVPAMLPVVAVDGRSREAADALGPWLKPGRTLVLLGSSGAGKSTLTNTLAGLHGDAAQTTGGVRRGDGRGQHTTTARSLHRTPQGACLIDTPGLRTLRLDLDPGRIGEVFADVEQLAPGCRFADCRHEAEPGCAVRPVLDATRLKSFHKLRREAERDRLSALERQALRREWKARGRAGRIQMAAKRGEG